MSDRLEHVETDFPFQEHYERVVRCYYGLLLQESLSNAGVDRYVLLFLVTLGRSFYKL